jgi:hypothetical protein
MTSEECDIFVVDEKIKEKDIASSIYDSTHA